MKKDSLNVAGRGSVVAGLLAVVAFCTPAVAQSSSDQVELREEVEALKARVAAQDVEIAAMRRDEDERWLTEQRAQEVRSLVMDVLADADTRASLLQGGLTAGYDKHFFIASGDGDFLMQLYSKLQTRFIYNSREAAPGEDEDRSGFEQRRMELYWAGHVITPDLTYKIKNICISTTCCTTLRSARWRPWPMMRSISSRSAPTTTSRSTRSN